MKKKLNPIEQSIIQSTQIDLNSIEKRALYGVIEAIVYSYSTKYKEGFILSELADIKSKFEITNEEKFNDALNGITCMLSPENETIIYHCDVELALKCGIENRNPKIEEWD